MGSMHAVVHLLLYTSPLVLYIIVALALALESSGIPIVNSTLLLFTGALASNHHCNIVILALVSIVSSVCGACSAYMIGLHGGRRVLLRLALFCRQDRHRVRLFERWFQKYGIAMVFASRIIPYIRPFTCFPAGSARTNFTRFFISVTLGSTIWCTSMLFIGWSLGQRWTQALYLMGRWTLPVLGLLLLLIFLYCICMHLFKRQMRARLHNVPFWKPRHFNGSGGKKDCRARQE